MKKITFLDAQILVVDDEPSKVRLVSELLGFGGYRNVASETDSSRASVAFQTCQPDLVILDLHMLPKDGFHVLSELEFLIPIGSYLPVLILTGDISSETKERALSAGAMDFLAKPFNSTEILLRVQNLLHTRALYLELLAERNSLEQRVQERTEEVLQGQSEILDRLALVSEFRDDATGDHTKRVSEIVRQVATDLSFPLEQVDLMARASLLHDIGKVCIPDNILMKPGMLTALEYERVKDHAAIGGEILKGSHTPLLIAAESIARYHHERWNGSGYSGLVGDAIPIEARITAIADVFDALMSARPYKDAWPPAFVLEEIERLSGTHFDPSIVASFLRVAPNLMKLYASGPGLPGLLREFVTVSAPSSKLNHTGSFSPFSAGALASAGSRGTPVLASAKAQSS